MAFRALSASLAARVSQSLVTEVLRCDDDDDDDKDFDFAVTGRYREYFCLVGSISTEPLKIKIER